MSDFENILNALRTLTKSKTDKEMCKILEVPYGTLDTWKNRQNIPKARLYEFSQRLGVSVDDLQNGSPTLKNETNETTSKTYAIKKITAYSASAGGGNEIDDIEVYETDEVMHIDRAFFKTPPSKKARAIKVDGYSMTPMLLPDSWVVFEECFDFKGDALYVINYSGQLMVKLLQLTPQGVLKVISKNSDYQSYEVNLKESNEHLMIVGKVIKCII